MQVLQLGVVVMKASAQAATQAGGAESMFDRTVEVEVVVEVEGVVRGGVKIGVTAVWMLWGQGAPPVVLLVVCAGVIGADVAAGVVGVPVVGAVVVGAMVAGAVPGVVVGVVV